MSKAFEKSSKTASICSRLFKQVLKSRTVLVELNWKPLASRRREKRLVLLYKIVNNLVAIPPDEHFAYKAHSNRSKTTNSKLIEVKHCDIDTYRYSFFPRTSLEWNRLSDREVVDCQSVNQFKAVLQQSI